MKRSIVIIFILLVVAGIFEIHPVVKYDRVVVPEEVYAGKDCNCRCVMESRPWYSRFNYWWWLWIVITPLIIFSVKPHASIYAGWWDMIWYQYHKRKTRLIDKEFKRDWVSRVTVWVSKYITLFILLIGIIISFAFAGLHILKFFGLLDLYKSLFF